MTLETTTISDLPDPSSPLTGTERVPMDRGTDTNDASTQQIADLANPAINNAVASHVAAPDPHPQYATGDEAGAAAAAAVASHVAAADPHPGYLLETDPAVTDARTPTAHKSTHATGGTDALTPADIGAATAAQGTLADSAVQSVTGTGPIASSGGTTPAISISAATTSAAGSMSSADKTKLNGIASGATANSSDAQLRDRANHTGTQAASTITMATARLLGRTTAEAGGAEEISVGAGLNLAGSTLSAVSRSASVPGILPATSFAAITYAATVDLDMAALEGQYRTISLTGALTLTTSNRAAGRVLALRLVCDGTLRALTFPAGWVFLGPAGSKPANIAANKTGVLSLTFFGTADTDCVAAWGAQS